MSKTPRQILDEAIKEKDWTQDLRDLARRLGWLEYHPYRSERSREGFPDLTLCRTGPYVYPRLIFAELKTETGRLTREQRSWLSALARMPGVEAYVWRPSMWETVKRVLADPLPPGQPPSVESWPACS